MASAVSWFLFSFVAVIISHFAVCVNIFFLTEQSFSHHLRVRTMPRQYFYQMNFLISHSILLRVASEGSESGSLISEEQSPKAPSAYLSGAGFVSKKSASMRGSSAFCSRSAAKRSPLEKCAKREEKCFGTRLEATEITPAPPSARTV